MSEKDFKEFLVHYLGPTRAYAHGVITSMKDYGYVNLDDQAQRKCPECGGLYEWEGDAPIPEPLSIHSIGMGENHCGFEGADSPRFEFKCPSCSEGVQMAWKICQECDNSGMIMGIRAGGIISRDMAMDAGMPEIAGSRMGNEPEPEPCPQCEGGEIKSPASWEDITEVEVTWGRNEKA